MAKSVLKTLTRKSVTARKRPAKSKPAGTGFVLVPGKRRKSRWF